MEIPQTYLQKFQSESREQHKPRTEREELLDKFLMKLNPPRQQAGMKLITYPHLASLLKAVPTSDLYPFFNECDKARNFSSLFWWKLKPKPSEV